MEHCFECACCGEEIDLFVDPDEGDVQEFSVECGVCGNVNIVQATFDYPNGSFVIETFYEAVG